ncbi:NrsF family protein, partial [Phenylobacterium sp.]|uniref:NrsF family protein n=1 Tax=Phenylobacterium sp. TaxID=1871053 RepID=UPI002E380D03
MKTDELIRSLTGELAPVAPGAAARRIALGLALGALASAAIMLAWLGLRPDLALAVSTPMFWMKF